MLKIRRLTGLQNFFKYGKINYSKVEMNHIEQVIRSELKRNCTILKERAVQDFVMLDGQILLML